MADFSQFLAILELDPDDPSAMAGLRAALVGVDPKEAAPRLASTRKVAIERGRPELAQVLLELELERAPSADARADLLLEKGLLLDEELCDYAGAKAAFSAALEARPGDELAQEALADLQVAHDNWQKLVDKYVSEAKGSTDRALATSMYMAAAAHTLRFAPQSPDLVAQLDAALEVDPQNRKAMFHRVRLLAAAGQWRELAEFWAVRAEHAPTREARVAGYLGLAEVSAGRLGDRERARAALVAAHALDAADGRVVHHLRELYEAERDWKALVELLTGWLRARRGSEAADAPVWVDVGELQWKRLGQLEAADEAWRRVRKVEPANARALDFYRELYAQDPQKLLAVLRQAEKAISPKEPEAEARLRALGREIAELAESQGGNTEKAIEAWKQIYRQNPQSQEARTALARLYRRAERWNALIDLLKEEIERADSGESTDAKIELYFELVEIYRDRQNSDLMVLNTYNSILKLDPENARAIDELAERYRALSRWNDLISILTRKAELPQLAVAARVALLREVAQLWAERFGNFANAIRPLERILELEPGDVEARAKLKDIYTRRRQWRALIDLLDKEAAELPSAERRARLLEMAKLAAERLGDSRLAIVIANRVLGEVDAAVERGEQGGAEQASHADALAMLAGFYEREKRFLALAEIMHRQRQLARDGKEAVALLERLGALYADRLSASALAAGIWQEILDLDPHHAKALRTLRELYASAGDYDGLERLYARIGMADDVVEALLGVADRLEGKALRLPVVERAAVLADKRAAESTRPDAADRAARVWERVLAVEPAHVRAAAALAPVYRRSEKWARLLSVLEIQLAAREERDERLAAMAEIRALCEQKLGSKTLAFSWALRAFELDPQSVELRGELVRLVSEPDQVRELVAALGRHAHDAALPQDVRVALLREQARLAGRRLGDMDGARALYRELWTLVPGDDEAESQLEEIALELADWADLRTIYQHQLARQQDPTEKARLLLVLASIEEEKLVDLDAAALTYERVLELDESSAVALRALARVHEARGDWENLVATLLRELSREDDVSRKIEMLLRIGTLEAQSLDRHDLALGHFTSALRAAEAHGRPAAPAVAVLARYLAAAGPGAAITAEQRAALARQLAPHLAPPSPSASPERYAAALELMRADPETRAEERPELDRKLLGVYLGQLGEPGAAWSAAQRLLAAEPTDLEARQALGRLAEALGRDGELAGLLSEALAAATARGAAATELRALATECALLADKRLGDRAAAERAWRVVLEHEPDAEDAFTALATAVREQARYPELRELLERKVAVTIAPARRRAALLELGALESELLREPERAVSAYRQVLDLDGDGADEARAAHHQARRALDRLFVTGERWAELARLLEDEIALYGDSKDLGDQAARRSLLLRRAELLAHRLSRPADAVELLEELITTGPVEAEPRRLLEELLKQPEQAAKVARLLEPGYEREGAWRSLVGALQAQVAPAKEQGDVAAAARLLARIAALEEEKLAQPRAALTAWSEVLALEPGDAAARAALLRLGTAGGWAAETAAVLDRAAARLAQEHADVPTQVAVLGELAALYDRNLGASDQAIETYQRQLEVDPANAAVVRGSGGALSRLLEERERWAELREVLRRRAEWANSGDERRSLLVTVADLEDRKLARVDQAVSTWQDVLAEHPGDLEALAALERLHSGQRAWRDLVEVLRQRAETTAEPAAAKLVRYRIARLFEQELSSPEDAIGTYLDILESDSDDGPSLAELARLYREAGRSGDLLEVLEKQLELAPPQRGRELEREIAELLGGALGRPREAQERWANLLGAKEPALRAVALVAIEASLDDVDLRSDAAEILRPHYLSEGNVEALASLYQRMAQWADSPSARLRCLLEVVTLRERTGDLAGAFVAQLAALAHAAAEPELPTVLAETERLAGELGREGELIDAYRSLAPDVLDAELQRRLYLDIADLARAVRQDRGLAREYYQKVLDAQPEDRRALVALESIYRIDGDDDRLAEVLLRQAEIVGTDIEDRLSAMVEAAQILSARGRVAESIELWEQVLGRAPERRDAVDALETLYQRDGRWFDLVELYERRLGYATTNEEAVALRAQIGEIREREMRDLAGAVENYRAALGGNPHHPAALAALERLLRDPEARPAAAEALEPIYVAQQRWHELANVYEARLEASADLRERLRMTLDVALLYEEQLEDFEAAARWYARLFREDPSDDGVRDQLQRLASVTGNWEFVADTYRDYLDDEVGDSQSVRDVAIAAASIFDRRLGLVDRALACYRRALAIITEPDHPPPESELIRRVEDMLGRASRFGELVLVYDDAISRAPSDAARRGLLAKRARVLEESLQDPKAAIETWRDLALTCDDDASAASQSAHREAMSELERLFRAGGQWRELAELFESRAARAQDEDERVEHTLRLAEVLERHLFDLDRAVDQYEAALLVPVGKSRALAALERLVVDERQRERIADLLEPVYRQADAWQKLVVILTAKLAYVNDVPQQVDMLHEIATIHEQRGGDLRLALEAAARAWHLDVADSEACQRLVALAARRGAWDFVATELTAGAERAEDPLVAAELWAQLAGIHDAQRSDMAAAVRAWQRVLSITPDDEDALAALDRLLTVEGRVEELVEVLHRRAELASSDDDRLVLLHRAAALNEEVLRRPRQAVEDYRSVLLLDERDLEALDGLDRLYSSLGEGRELVGILLRKLELSTAVLERVALRRRLAQVYEHELGDDFGAIGQLGELLDEDAGNAGALVELDRLYDKGRLWPELLEVIDRRAALVVHQSERADLAVRAGRLVEQELADPLSAIERYQRVLADLPLHLGARAALEALLASDHNALPAAAVLEPLARATGELPLLVRVLERKLVVEEGDPASHLADFSALAQAHEQLAGQPALAFDTWARALAAHPDELSIVGELLRLAKITGKWAELAALLEAHLGRALDPESHHQVAMNLGQVYEDHLGDLAGASSAFERAASGSGERVALAALERVLAKERRHPELAAVLRRAADAAEDDQAAAEFLFRQGDVLETLLGDLKKAVRSYRDVLALAPAHPGARAALERLLRSAGDDRADIVATLEPLFEQDAQWSRLLAVLEVKYTLTTDRHDRIALAQQITELARAQLGDSPRAFEAALRWLRDDPPSQAALQQVDELAIATGRWAEVVELLDSVAHSPSAGTGEERVALLSYLGDCRMSQLGDIDGAIASYRAALAIDRGAVRVLGELIDILRHRGDRNALAELLAQRADVLDDPAGKRADWEQVAILREEVKDVPGAISAWRRILELDESDRPALTAVVRLLRTTGDRDELVAALALSAQHAASPSEEHELRTQIAKLETDPARVILAWQTVLDLSPEDSLAIAELEACYRRNKDWISVAELQTRRFGDAKTTPDKLAILAEMAELAEKHREAPEDAVGHWFTALELEPGYGRALDELERLLGKLGRWHDVADLLERRAEQEAETGNLGAELRLLARLADLWEEKLDSPERAGELVERILQRDPASVPALTRLSRLYERAGDWSQSKSALERALELGPHGSDAADLFFRLAEVARVGDSDPDTAVQHLQQALRHEPSHSAALAALEKLARERRDTATLVELLRQRARGVAEPGERVALALEISELDRKAGRTAEALAELEAASAVAPTDSRVWAPLADLLFAAGRLDEAAPIYERLAGEAKAARRMRDVARYRQRQGGILEARGDSAGALSAYEEAFRVNPTDVATMAGLGRLYFTAKEWEKARRLYQSLVLQPLDAESGISKADVYWSLGIIHLELGQEPKAKGMFQRGLEIDPRHERLRSSLAQLGG